MKIVGSIAAATALLLGSLGCGDDSSAGTGGAGGEAATTTTATTTSTSSSQAATATSSGTGGGTTADTTGVTSTSVGSGGGGGGDAGGGGGGLPVACDTLPAGPFAPTLLSNAFDGSEDIAFDGLGHLAGKRGSDMILVDGDGNDTVLASGVPSAFGTRYDGAGSLVVALPGEGRVIAIDAGGDVADLATGLNGPNGIHVTSDGIVWVTELSVGRIQRIGPGLQATPFLDAGEAPSANGIFVDEARGLVFFTNYSAGELRRVDLAGTEAPTLVATIPGAALDGLTMDVCGNVYAVDQGNAIVYRVRTDAAGDAVGDVEEIADLPTGVANAQFGRGAGFSPTTLYVAGNPGDVYAVDVGIEGAPQVGP